MIYSMSHIILIIFIFILQENCESARILGVAPTPSYSHQVVLRPIWRELANRGHEVIVITTDPENKNITNLKEIDVSFTYDMWTNRYNMIKMVEKHKYNVYKLYKFVMDAILDICDQELKHLEVQKLLRNESEYFDVVLVENLIPVMLGFSERFKCPAIGVTTINCPNAHHFILGNPVHSVAYPDSLFKFADPSSFWGRLGSSIYDTVLYMLIRFRDTTDEQRVMESHFGEKLPNVKDVVKNMSMIFINEDPIFNTRPIGPCFALIGGGVHLEAPKPLPKDLQKYLDSAKNGAIYFSFGSNVKSEIVSVELLNTILETFRELPYKVLWKFDVTDISDLPENVKISKWLPQQDILRHRNTKLFITQGGLQSMEESIFCNVPLLGIPFILDQFSNVIGMVEKGIGLSLNKDSITKESLKEAILEMINNPKYKQRTVEIVKLSKDQPMTGLEKAVWWTEYIIRHKGAPHLRNPVIDLPFYQYYFLDVIGFLTGIMAFLLFVIFKIVLSLKKCIFKNKKVKQN